MESWRERGADQRLGNRYLSTDDYRRDTESWATSQGLNVFHYRIESCKEPFIEVDEEEVIRALEQIIGASPLSSRLPPADHV